MKAIILMTGHTFENLIPIKGDFDAWFKRHVQNYSKDLINAWEVIDAMTCSQYPSPESVDILLVSGSPQSVYECPDWSVKAGEWVKLVIEANAFVLGICYGHQLIAQAMGGTVAKAKKGREMGRCTVEQMNQDLLFATLPQTFDVWQTHSDEVVVPPAMATVIAKNAHCAIQAMAIGDRCRTMQWHPEIDLETMKHYFKERQAILNLELGAELAQERHNQLHSELSSGSEIFKQFFQAFIFSHSNQ